MSLADGAAWEKEHPVPAPKTFRPKAEEYPEWVRDAARRIGGDVGLIMAIIWHAYNSKQ